MSMPDGVGGADVNSLEKVITPDTEWSQSYAAKIVVSDFQKAEAYRTQNQDWRMRNADELYLAWTGQKYWEGTRNPRSSLGFYVSYEQIESLLPSVMSAVFAGYPPFDVEPEPTSTWEQAEMVKDLTTYQLDRAGAKEQVRKAFKSAFIYGNGLVELGWESFERQRQQFLVQRSPVIRDFTHPVTGEVVSSTVGSRPRTVIKPVKEIVNQPTLKYRALQDFYVDPNLQSSCLQEATYCAIRELIPIVEIEKYRGQKFFDIPDRMTLFEMSKAKSSTQGDYSKANTELMRAGQYWPTQEFTADPAQQRLEVIRYVTPYRLCWIIGRNSVPGGMAMLNVPNPYGFTNFFNICYTDVPNRFYGLAVTDIAEGDQRLITSITNARVDELNLAIHKPLIVKRGVFESQSQLRMRPGMNIKCEDPKNDIQTFEYGAILANAYMETDAAERRLQKYTGITDLAMLGTPSAGGNSANRTATGVNRQAQASGRRIQYFVETAEQAFLEPILTGVHKLNQKFLDPQQVVDILGPQGQKILIDPMQVKNADVKFRFLASEKMASQSSILQAIPTLAQSLLNPAYQAQLAQINQKKVNVEFIGTKICDALRLRGGDVFIDLTPQDIQRMNQPSPADQLKDGMQDKRLASQENVAQEGNAASIMKELLSKGMDHAMAPEEEEEGGEESE
jgi:hypothetical protein